ncbi:MAG: TetR/AcrR family transcriptional regulator [Bacteroidetes bacterium]|nr:TetR/AcrR family transcriptional regulator [Bacteroidota bacterium]
MARTKDFDEDEVLQKAMNLFWLKGYNATSMQDLVDGLGISRSSLYDTYGDKHTLFIRALKRYRESAQQKLSKIIDEAPTAREGIRRMLEYTIKELAGDKEQKGCFLVNAAVEVAPHDAEVNKMLCENDSRMEEFLFALIQKGQERGEITNKSDAKTLADFIFNNIKGMRVTARAVSNKSFFNDMIGLTMSVLG